MDYADVIKDIIEKIEAKRKRENRILSTSDMIIRNILTNLDKAGIPVEYRLEYDENETPMWPLSIGSNTVLILGEDIILNTTEKPSVDLEEIIKRYIKEEIESYLE